MNLKQNHYSRRALALLLTLVMCVGMIPTAFAAQQNSYHDPAEPSHVVRSFGWICSALLRLTSG